MLPWCLLSNTAFTSFYWGRLTSLHLFVGLNHKIKNVHVYIFILYYEVVTFMWLILLWLCDSWNLCLITSTNRLIKLSVKLKKKKSLLKVKTFCSNPIMKFTLIPHTDDDPFTLVKLKLLNKIESSSVKNVWVNTTVTFSNVAILMLYDGTIKQIL